MTRSVKTCDRCGKDYDQYKFPQIRFKTKVVRIKITKIFSPNPYDYIDEIYDLCPKCASEFERWMSNGKDENHESRKY